MAKTILIVDDEASIRDMIGLALRRAGYECLHAADASQARAAIVAQRPDLILLNWMLPGQSGIEFAFALKRSETTCDIPIIMLTARGEEDLARLAFRCVFRLPSRCRMDIANRKWCGASWPDVPAFEMAEGRKG